MSIKRVHFFNGEFLNADDLNAEQEYHLTLRRRHNQELHTAGIVTGLDVTVSGGKVTVASGMAVDRMGREIVLETPEEVIVASGVTLSIKYKEEETDEVTEAGVTGKKRVKEFHEWTIAATGDQDAVPLARITGTAPNFTIDNSVRRFAGPAVKGDFSVPRNLGIGTTNPGAGLEVDKGATNDLAVRLTSSGPGWGSGMQFRNTGTGGKTYGIYSGFGNLHFTDVDNSVDRLLINGAGNVGIGTTNPASGRLQFDNNLGNKVVIYDNGPTDRYGLGLNGGNLSAFIPAGGRFSVRQNGYDGTEVMAVTGAGNLGIGTTTPKAKLQVVGGAIMPEDGNTDATGILFPSDPGGGGGDKAWIRYYARTGEDTTLEIGTSNDPQDHISLMPSGNVGIGTLTPGFKFDVADRMRVRQGPNGTAGIWMYQTAPNADRAFIGMANDSEVGLWGNTGGGWGLLMDTTTTTTRLLASTNPIYFTNTWLGTPDNRTNVSEISNDVGGHKTLMIVGNKSAGLGRRVSVWDRFEVNGTFVNNSSIKAKQDLQVLSGEDYKDIHNKLMQTPLYRYRFKATGIDQKLRMGVISEECPEEILDETGKYVSMLDYVGFLFAAVKAQANEIGQLAMLIRLNAKDDNVNA